VTAGKERERERVTDARLPLLCLLLSSCVLLCWCVRMRVYAYVGMLVCGCVSYTYASFVCAYGFVTDRWNRYAYEFVTDRWNRYAYLLGVCMIHK